MKKNNCIAELRKEIVESQKTQAEFFKWKLLAIGVVSSISLGFTNNSGSSFDFAGSGRELLLCAIPLICA